jgi:hypothetical protein
VGFTINIAGCSFRQAQPAQDSVRPGYGRDFGENLAAQAMTDLAQRASLGV